MNKEDKIKKYSEIVDKMNELYKEYFKLFDEMDIIKKRFKLISEDMNSLYEEIVKLRKEIKDL